jgi:hypothetical protein
MNSPHNSSPLTNHNIDQPPVVIPESGLMRHDDPESTGQRTDLESITNSGKRSRDEQENKDLLSVLSGPDSHSKRARRDIQDVEDANETLIVTFSPDLAETQTQQPLSLQLSTQVIPAPSRSLDGHNDLPNLVSGNILDMDTSDDTEPEIEDNHCIFNVPQQVLLNETTSREDEVMDSFELHPSTSVLATERDGTDDTEIPSLSDTTAPLRNRTIPVVYGLPNIGVACHAIAPTQLLAATASVLQCVEETRSNVRGVNNPSMLISRGIVSVTNPSEQDRKDGVKCLDRAHRQLAPDQAGLQDDAGDFMDKAIFELGYKAPKLRKTYTCTSCSHEKTDDNNAHDYFSAVWHIKATDKSVEEGIRKALRFDVKKLCSECGKNTVHDVIIKVQKPQTLPVIAIIIDRVGTGGTVNLDRVSFPMTLRGVGLGGNRRLVGICSHIGKSSRYGHYVATARRFVPVKRPTNDDDDAGFAEVPPGTFLRFDDGCNPRPLSVQDIVDDESEYKTSILLYEIAPDDYQDEGGLPLSGRRPSSASTVSINDNILAPNLANLAILKEKILFRGDIREGRPTEARLERARKTIRILLKRLIKDEGNESIFSADPSYVLRGQNSETEAGESSIIHGQCQLGKTGVTLLLCWIAHFIYDTIPVVIVKSAGGAESISQFSGAIDDFNKKINNIFDDEPDLKSDDLSYIKKFHLIAGKKTGTQVSNHSADIDESIFKEGGAQVLFRLLNATNLIVYLTQGREGGNHPRSGDFPTAKRLYRNLNSDGYLWHRECLSKGRVRLTVLFDEGDMTVTTSDRDENRVERQLFVPGQLRSLIRSIEWSFVESVHHSVFITATPATLFFTSRPNSLVRVISLPIKKDYFGFSEHVPDDRRFCKENGTVMTTAEDTGRCLLSNGEPDYLSNHPGIGFMAGSVMDDLCVNDNMRRMILVNAESILKGQHGIQDGLVNVARDRDFHTGIFVVAHNGGNDESILGGFKYACSIITNGISNDILEKFNQPESKDSANEVFTWDLRSKLMMNRQESNVSTRVQGAKIGFRRGVDIRDILTMINRAAKLVYQQKSRWPLVCIVTGAMGGRGISYKDNDHEMHLTDEYLYINPGSSRQHTSIQLASRICGRYPQLIDPSAVDKEPPSKLWCSSITWNLISGMIQLEDEIVRIARDAYFQKKPVFKELLNADFPKFEHINHLRQLRIAAPRVMRYWKGRESKRLADHSIIVAKTEKFWDVRLNKFFWKVFNSKVIDLAFARSSVDRSSSSNPIDTSNAEVERSASASQVLKWTPEVIQKHVNKSQMINGISFVDLDNIATELVECVLTDTDSKELERLMERLDRDPNHDRQLYNFAKKVLDGISVVSDSYYDNSGIRFATKNVHNLAHSKCPFDYDVDFERPINYQLGEVSTDRRHTERTCRFVPASNGKSGRIWIIRQRRTLQQIRDLSYRNGTRTVIWHRFETSEDDNGMEDPSVHLLARIEYVPKGDSMAAREALESASLKTSWKPVYTLFDNSADEEETFIPGDAPNITPSKTSYLTEHFLNLKVPEGSTQEVIRNAYLFLARANHPDKGGDEEAFKEIINSYEILCKNVDTDDEFPDCNADNQLRSVPRTEHRASTAQAKPFNNKRHHASSTPETAITIDSDSSNEKKGICVQPSRGDLSKEKIQRLKVEHAALTEKIFQSFDESNLDDNGRIHVPEPETEMLSTLPRLDNILSTTSRSTMSYATASAITFLYRTNERH